MVDPEQSYTQQPPGRIEPFDMDDGGSDEDGGENPLEEITSIPLEDAEAGNTLPSVEEAHSSIAHRARMSPVKRNRMICYGLLVLVVAALAVTVISLAVDLDKTKTAAEESDKLSANGENDNGNPGNADVGRPKDELKDELKAFLLDNNISSSASFDDPQSPQSLAQKFLSDEKANGHLTEMYSDIDDADQKQRIIERYVLVLIYYHFNGDSWNEKYQFLSHQDHCTWYETYVLLPNLVERRFGIAACNDESHVETIRLQGNNLKNKKDVDMPEEIRHLKMLKLLNLRINDISGNFGNGFQHLGNLEGLFIGSNKMHGTIPSWIGNLKALQFFQITGNLFDGDVPDSFSNLVNMRNLYLDDNALRGNLDLLLKDMVFLEEVYVENNAFSGSLGWAENKLLLKKLDASKNNMGGDLKDFPTLLQHPNLVILDVHGNNFYGKLPENITENKVLELLSLHSNKLEGSIPDSINALRSLYMLDLSYNEFTGIIPTFESILNLEFLIISGNKFAKQNIPDLWTHSSLIELSMKGNNLKGGIPEWIGNLTGIAILDLDANELTGPIPKQIGQLEEVQVLLLNRNDFDGTLPTEMASLKLLDTFLLDGNAITGNASAIFCDGSMKAPTRFIADCQGAENGEPAQLECSCCTECCVSGDATCNDLAWGVDNDPFWEDFASRYYAFNISDAPSELSKVNDGNP